ncbi:hypothetical protein Tco_1163948 [Tanacetum coccineum]
MIAMKSAVYPYPSQNLSSLWFSLARIDSDHFTCSSFVMPSLLKSVSPKDENSHLHTSCPIISISTDSTGQSLHRSFLDLVHSSNKECKTHSLLLSERTRCLETDGNQYFVD